MPGEAGDGDVKSCGLCFDQGRKILVGREMKADKRLQVGSHLQVKFSGAAGRISHHRFVKLLW
jgi:hypothetical protein